MNLRLKFYIYNFLFSKAERIGRISTRTNRATKSPTRRSPSRKSPSRRSPGRLSRRSPGRSPRRSPGRSPRRSPGRSPSSTTRKLPIRSTRLAKISLSRIDIESKYLCMICNICRLYSNIHANSFPFMNR